MGEFEVPTDGGIWVPAGDDYRTAGNPGRTKAIEAARAVTGKVATPIFGDERPEGATDFNDLHQALGPEAVREAVDGARYEPLAQAQLPPCIDLAWAKAHQPEAPRSLFPGIPEGSLTLVAAGAGIGKSQIWAVQLGIAFASGKPIWNAPHIERRRVLVLSFEDRKNVWHWRLVRACASLGMDLASLQGWLHVIDCVGIDGTLYVESRGNVHGTTPLYDEVRRYIAENSIGVVIIDGCSDTLGASEIERGPVKRFLSCLVGLIPESGAVLLLAHVDKQTAKGTNTKEQYSGNTAFNAGARARWYGRAEEDSDGRRTGRIVYSLEKANHEEVGAQIEFRWDEKQSVFVGRFLTATTPVERAQQEQGERAALLHVLRQCAAAGTVVPAAMGGPRTAYHVMSAHAAFPDVLKGAAGKRRFWQHIEALRMSGDVYEAEHRKANRHVVAQLCAREAASKTTKF